MAAGAGAGPDAAAGAASVVVLSTGTVSAVIGACGVGGTVPTAVAPAARLRPKSMPNPGTDGGSAAGELNPAVGGIPPPGKPPKPLNSDIGNPVPPPPPGKLGNPLPAPSNEVNGPLGTGPGPPSDECPGIRPPGSCGGPAGPGVDASGRTPFTPGAVLGEPGGPGAGAPAGSVE